MSEALGSIPSGYPYILVCRFVSMLIHHQLLTTSSYHKLANQQIIVTKSVPNEIPE